MNRRLNIPSRLYWAARTAAFVAAEQNIPRLPYEKLQKLRDARTRHIVDHAYKTVPFYRKAMDERGIRPKDFHTAEDLALLPVISGQDLSANPQQFLSSAYSGKTLLELMTSGSSGHAKQIFWDKAAIFRAHAAGMRHREVLASFVGRRSGYRLVSVTRSGGTSDDVRAFHRQHSWVPARANPLRVSISPSESFERAVQRINEHKPDVIGGFGAYIGAIYRWAWVNGREIRRPKVISYGGENMLPQDRELLETEFGIPVITSYQACEALRIAFQCECARGLHISVDQTDVRIADSEGVSREAGTPGHVLISNLVNRATVLLNYDLGDLGVMSAASCECGRTLPVLDRLDGRADDFLMLPGGEVAHDSVVLSSLFGIPGVMRIQLIQESLNMLEVKVVCDEKMAWSTMRGYLDRALTEALGTNAFDVSWTRVKEIKSEPNGKFKSIVCRVPQGKNPR